MSSMVDLPMATGARPNSSIPAVTGTVWPARHQAPRPAAGHEPPLETPAAARTRHVDNRPGSGPRRRGEDTARASDPRRPGSGTAGSGSVSCERKSQHSHHSRTVPSLRLMNSVSGRCTSAPGRSGSARTLPSARSRRAQPGHAPAQQSVAVDTCAGLVAPVPRAEPGGRDGSDRTSDQ